MASNEVSPLELDFCSRVCGCEFTLTFESREAIASFRRDHPRVSVSHTQGISVVASALEGRIGVDIESLGPFDSSCLSDIFALHQHSFTAREWDFIAGSKENFFIAWTRKEAVLKLFGIGVLIDLQRVEILSDGSVLVDQQQLKGILCFSFLLADAYAVSVATDTRSYFGQPIDLSTSSLHLP